MNTYSPVIEYSPVDGKLWAKMELDPLCGAWVAFDDVNELRKEIELLRAFHRSIDMNTGRGLTTFGCFNEEATRAWIAAGGGLRSTDVDERQRPPSAEPINWGRA